MAKMRIPMHLQVHAPPEKVFGYISDLTKAPEWATNPLAVEPLSGGAPHVGSKYHSDAKFMGKKVPADQEITAFEPPTHFAFTTREEGMSYHHEWNIRALGDETEVDREVTVEVPGFKGAMMKLGIGALTPRLTKKNIAMLKEKLES